MSKENSSPDRQTSSEAKAYFEQYWRYCSALRNWFVAYGIGGCVLFISDKAKIFQDLSAFTKAIVVIAFLFGVVAQILLADRTQARVFFTKSRLSATLPLVTFDYTYRVRSAELLGIWLTVRLVIIL